MTLQDMRTKRGLSQSQLAKAAGIKVRSLQHYEQGQRDIDGAKLETLINLAAALQCSVTDLLQNPELKSKCKEVTL